MIIVDGATKRYGSTTVLDGVSATLQAGQLIALVGANGAGKSTLLSAIGRLTTLDAGRVTVNGLDVGVGGPALARHLSILRQDNHLPVRLTVEELIGFGRFPHNAGRPGPDDDAAVGRAIGQLGLEGLKGRRLDELSGGQRQRAFIAMVLCQDTPFVLLDEPLNNLDMRHAVETMTLLRRLVDEFDKTVVVVLHDVNVAAGFADRILALRDGRLVADGPPGELMQRDVLAEVFDLDVEVCDVGGHRIALSFLPPRPTDELHSNRETHANRKRM